MRFDFQLLLGDGDDAGACEDTQLPVFDGVGEVVDEGVLVDVCVSVRLDDVDSRR